MKYNTRIHHRRSIRLKGYDYSLSGAYFITICTYKRECYLGEIRNNEIILNDFGGIVRDEWLKTETIRSEIKLDKFVVMPNHVHGIVIINNECCRGDRPIAPTTNERPIKPTGPNPKSIGSLIAGFKSIVTKRINQIRHTPGIPVWQRNYYEHIIRDETELNKIQKYIIYNPLNWESDENYKGDD